MPRKQERARTTVWILGDQLTPDAASLRDRDPTETVVFMVESLTRARRLPYHKQKISFLWSAMRHFAEELRTLGYTVDYHRAQTSYRPALQRHMKRYRPTRVRIMEPSEHGRGAALASLVDAAGASADRVANDLFLADSEAFEKWTRGKKRLPLETFYREMRRRTGLLMDGDQPAGGRWNYDDLNRETPPADHAFPPIPAFPADATTRAVERLVARELPDHFGELGNARLPVTRADARRFADDFFAHRLDLFGPYEDAIVAGERALYYSLLSTLINVGLLEPLSLCREAERRYRSGEARLASVEGFIRQIIGWREFVHQVYQLEMPGYIEQNQLGADLPLPSFYWDGETDMHCVADAVRTLRRFGSNHHIQRLMVTGNFALIAGIDPQKVNEWYGLAYTDAYEWVVTPNVIGMALFADGGRFATKPYAASANYLNKMSDCCKDCAYDSKAATSDEACPFNSLYWDFVDRTRSSLDRNPRMKMIQRAWEKRSPKDRKAVRRRASELRRKLERGERI